MSYESEQMQNLKNAIRQEIPQLTKEIKIQNMLKLVELSNGKYNVLTDEEKLEILKYIKNEMNEEIDIHKKSLFFE